MARGTIPRRSHDAPQIIEPMVYVMVVPAGQSWRAVGSGVGRTVADTCIATIGRAVEAHTRRGEPFVENHRQKEAFTRGNSD
jgi:hypothetical protein